MATTTRLISLDVARPNIMPSIAAKQFDADSRFINVEITEMGEKITLENNSVAMINIKKPDGSNASYSGSINEDGTVHIVIPNWALDSFGTLACSVSVVSDNTRLTTLHFTIDVEEAETIKEPSEDEPDIWAQALSDIAELKAENLTLQSELADTKSELENVKAELMTDDNELYSGIGYTAKLVPTDDMVEINAEKTPATPTRSGQLTFDFILKIGTYYYDTDTVVPHIFPFSEYMTNLILEYEIGGTVIVANVSEIIASAVEYLNEHGASATGGCLLQPYGQDNVQDFVWFVNLSATRISQEEYEAIEPLFDDFVNSFKNWESFKWTVQAQEIIDKEIAISERT